MCSSFYPFIYPKPISQPEQVIKFCNYGKVSKIIIYSTKCFSHQWSQRININIFKLVSLCLCMHVCICMCACLCMYVCVFLCISVCIFDIAFSMVSCLVSLSQHFFLCVKSIVDCKRTQAQGSLAFLSKIFTSILVVAIFFLLTKVKHCPNGSTL